MVLWYWLVFSDANKSIEVTDDVQEVFDWTVPSHIRSIRDLRAVFQPKKKLDHQNKTEEQEHADCMPSIQKYIDLREDNRKIDSMITKLQMIDPITERKKQEAGQEVVNSTYFY